MRGLNQPRIIPRLCIGLGWILIAFVASGALAITRVQVMSDAINKVIDQSIPISTAARDIDRQLDLLQLVQDDATAFQDSQLSARAAAANAQLLADFRIIAAHDAGFPAIHTLMERNVRPLAMALDTEVFVAVKWALNQIAHLSATPDQAQQLRLCKPPQGGAPQPQDGAPPPQGGASPSGPCVYPPPSMANGMVPGSPTLDRYHAAMQALAVEVAVMQAATRRTSSDARSTAIITIVVCLGVGIVVVILLGLQLARAILAANTQLLTLATRDPLTGLYNQRRLVEALDRALASASRHGTPCSILFFDIDHFKALNDTYGHPAGDTALKGFADCVAAQVRSVDIFGRWGGEEFMAILPTSDSTTAFTAAERIRAAVAAYRFDAGYGGHITCSIGVASYKDDGESRNDLIAAADRALYTAKRLGRNGTCRASDPAAGILAHARS